jgi:hypothetical protein
MTEEYLFYVWQYRLYSPELKLSNGGLITVLHPGDKNTDSGPDFFNARIRIGDTVWAGNVEIHIRTSDWKRHGHEKDPAYDNVILHVVFNNDFDLFRKDGSPLPTVIMEKQLSENSWKRYLQFMASRSWIPCEGIIHQVDGFILSSWLERLLAERLERKTAIVENALAFSGNDWNQAFYRLLARNMGFKLNNEAFELLAVSLPYRYLQKHADDLFQLEAMIFGQAGMLQDSFSDAYPNQLQKEYLFLRKKFSLVPIDGHLWRFMRLHPGNFPTIRLSQFASIIHQSHGLLANALEYLDLSSFNRIFQAEASAYWCTHYVFDKAVKYKSRNLGDTAVRLLIINLVAPFLFVYGKQKGEKAFVEHSLDLYHSTEGEINTITRQWKALGIIADNAARSQALIELKNYYCNSKKCLSCSIGINLLKNSSPEI